MHNQSVIVQGPQGCGKTFHADRIKRHFGLSRVVDEGNVALSRVQPEATGVLYLTCGPLPRKFKEIRVVRFADVARAIGLPTEARG